MKGGAIVLLVMALSFWAMFQVEPTSFREPPAKPTPFPHMTPIPETSKILIIPSGNLMFNTPDGIFIRRYYKKDLDWDVLGTLR